MGAGLEVFANARNGVDVPPAAKGAFGRRDQVAHQLALPGVPHARSYGADIGHRQDQQQAQAFRRLDDAGEAGDGLRIGDIALLRVVGKHQVMANQPGDLVDLPGFQAQALASPARGDFTTDFLALLVALAGIVQQHGQIQAFLVLELRHQTAGQGVFVLVAPVFDAVDDVDGAQRMLIDRIGMVHVELGLGDDAAELGDITAEQACLRHQAQRLVRILAAHQDVEEQPGCVRIAAQPGRDEAQVAGDRREGVGMQVELHPVGHLEQLEHRHRRLGEDVRPGDRQPAADHRKARMVGLVEAHYARLDHLGQARQWLGFL